MEFFLRQEHKKTDTFHRLNGIQRLKESALILALLSSVFILISLFSYNPADPSWSQTAWDGVVKNAAGNAGAWLADTLFFALGNLAYLLPFLLFLGGGALFRAVGPFKILNYSIIATKILGLLLLFLTSCGLAGLNFDDFGYFSSGGVVGDVLISLSLPIFNVLGTTLVFIFLWAAGFTLFSGISWLTVVDIIGEKILMALTKGVNYIRGEQSHTYGVQQNEHVHVSTFDNDPLMSLPKRPQINAGSSLEPKNNIDISKLNSGFERKEAPSASEGPIIHAPKITPYPQASSFDEAASSVAFKDTRKDPLSSRDASLTPEKAMDTQSETPKPVRVFKNVYKKPPPSVQGALSASLTPSVTPVSSATEPLINKNKTIFELEAETEAENKAPAVEKPFIESHYDDFADEEPLFEDTASFEEDAHQNDPLAHQASFSGSGSDRGSDGFQDDLGVDAMDDTLDVTSNAFRDEPTFDGGDLTPNESEDDLALEIKDEIETDVESAALDIEERKREAEYVVNQEKKEVDPFLETVREAQKNAAGALHPFLVKNEVNLPKPAEPLPTLALLDPPKNTATRASDEELQHMAHLIETRLEDYKINVKVKGIFPGPVITRFELELAPGVKVSRIMGLSKDIARSLSASAVRVVDVIPGKPYVGLELPNASRETVFMSEVVGSERFQSAKSPLSVVLGKDIAGEAIVTDLGKAPHMLVAGTTGSGKSVGVNVMIVSILYKAAPEDVRFIMIDPKMLELSVYEGIPHLLTEVVTDMKDAGNALRWCVAEMERRYKLMSVLGVRNIEGYNDKIKEASHVNHPIPDPFWKPGDSMAEEAPLLEKLPFIVVIVDEFADLMMVVGKKVEELIARLAQKARAAGIHLVLATQRPSVDVITGLIKANIPTRMAFTVSTKTDSRTILDQSGADSLLGMGDMLFMPNGTNHPVRVHGAFVNDDEVHRVVNNWKARGKPQYISEILVGDQGADGLLPGESPMNENGDELDPLFDQVVEFVTESRRASVSGVQRRFKIGYNRAARIVEQLEGQGIVSAPGHNSNREVLAPAPLQD